MAKPPIEGEGALRVAGETSEVAYRLQPPASSGRAGKGSVSGEAQHMRAAFHAGRVMLHLDDGRQLPILVTAHTEGGATAYFEY